MPSVAWDGWLSCPAAEQAEMKRLPLNNVQLLIIDGDVLGSGEYAKGQFTIKGTCTEAGEVRFKMKLASKVRDLPFLIAQTGCQNQRTSRFSQAGENPLLRFKMKLATEVGWLLTLGGRCKPIRDSLDRLITPRLAS